MMEHKLPSLFPWRWAVLLVLLAFIVVYVVIGTIWGLVVLLAEREKRVWRGN